MNNALAATVTGAIAFSEHTCADASSGTRRRPLASSNIVTIDTTATVRNVAHSDDQTIANADEVTASVALALEEAATSGSLAQEIANETAALDTSSPLRTVSVSLATSQPAPNDDEDDDGGSGSWETLSLSILVVNAIGIVAFSLYMRQKLTKAGRPVSSGNDMAISLGWIDQISDLLFGVELIGLTPNASAAVKAIGAVSLLWFVTTSVYNYVQYRRSSRRTSTTKRLSSRKRSCTVQCKSSYSARST